MQFKLLAVIGFVILFNFLFYRSGVGIITFILFLTINSLLYYLRNQESKNKLLAISSSAISITSAFLLCFSANELLAVLNSLVAVLSFIAAFHFSHLETKFNYSLANYFTIPLKSAASFIEGLFTIPKLAEHTKMHKLNSPIFSSLLRGILFAVPVAIVLVVLFSSADPVYSKYTGDIFLNIKEFLAGPFWERLIISALVLFASLATLSALTKLTSDSTDDESTKNIESNKQIELIAFLSIPIILFFSFLVIQFEYLFTTVSERQLSQIGVISMTYSEYVRRGFVELMIVSSISLGIIAVVSRFLHRVKNRNEKIIKSLIAILIIQTQVLLFSVFWRVMMYQMEHGLTRYRVIGMYILIALSSTLFLYLLKTIKNIRPKVLFLGIAAIGFLTISMMTLTNPDRLIAVNFKPTVNERIDNFYISELSFDAVDGWTTVLADLDKTITSYTQDTSLSIDDYYQINCAYLSVIELENKKNYLDNKYKVDGLKHWKELNFSEYNAFQKISQSPEYNRIPALKTTAEKLMTEYKKTDQYPYAPYCGSY